MSARAILAALQALAPFATTLALSAAGALVFASLVLLVTRSRIGISPRVSAFLWWLVAARAIAGLLWSVPLPVCRVRPRARVRPSRAGFDSAQPRGLLKSVSIPPRRLR